MVIDEYINFLDDFLKKISEKMINISGLDLDHLGYQTSSSADYKKIKDEMVSIGVLINENMVGGRRVGLYKLHYPLKYNNYSI